MAENMDTIKDLKEQRHKLKSDLEKVERQIIAQEELCEPDEPDLWDMMCTYPEYYFISLEEYVYDDVEDADIEAIESCNLKVEMITKGLIYERDDAEDTGWEIETNQFFKWGKKPQKGEDLIPCSYLKKECLPPKFYDSAYILAPDLLKDLINHDFKGEEPSVWVMEGDNDGMYGIGKVDIPVYIHHHHTKKRKL